MEESDRWHHHGRYCVVLNSNRLPLSFVPLRKGLKLVLTGKAEILESGHAWRSERHSHPVPSTVVLKEFRHTGSRYHEPAILSQQNLFQRDEYRCVYCERHVLELKPRETLTRDHLTPRAAGGRDDWRNCVTACSTCNHFKDRRHLSEIQSQVAELETKLLTTTDRNKQVQLERDLERLRPFTKTVKGYVPTVFELLIKRHSKYKPAA